MSGIVIAFVGNSYGSIPVNTSAPVISGTAAVGNILTSSTGTWTGAPTPTYSYQWQKNGTNISGATSSTYTVDLADIGKPLRCVVTATNSVGFTAANSANTTSVPDIPIGTAAGGGYYTGKIVQGGTTYLVIVAPRSSGENLSLAWRNPVAGGPSQTITLNNGPAASASMNSAAYPAAQFCENLSIGGYTDWYLPARDELELCYRSFKPTTAANQTWNRTKSTYTYPEGNDTTADPVGTNRNSIPQGSGYQSNSPSQTSVTAFRDGNSEAFNSISYLYWSSSEFGYDTAWCQYFGEGGQYHNASKTAIMYVRAVRRIAI